MSILLRRVCPWFPKTIAYIKHGLQVKTKVAQDQFKEPRGIDFLHFFSVLPLSNIYICISILPSNKLLLQKLLYTLFDHNHRRWKSRIGLVNYLLHKLNMRQCLPRLHDPHYGSLQIHSSVFINSSSCRLSLLLLCLGCCCNLYLGPFAVNKT